LALKSTNFENRASSRHYKKLLARATKQVTLYSHYSRGVVPARDLWMVKRSDICPAVFCGDPYGVGSPTATPFKMARSHSEQAKLDVRKRGRVCSPQETKFIPLPEEPPFNLTNQNLLAPTSSMLSDRT
jgi:hypothetical protein